MRNVSVRGLQVGGTTTLAIDGDDLGKAPKLLLPFAAKATLQPKSTDKQAAFEVALGDDVPPGYHHLRVVAEGGVSLPVLVGVDRLPQKPFGPAIESLPVALHGTVNGSTVVETTFTGKAGQKVQIEVESQRLGGKLRPVLHLVGPRKLQVAWSWPAPALLGDTRIEATLPDDGTYTIALHDAEYAAPAPGFFRLKVGQWQHADQVFPPVIGRDAKSVELIGSGEKLEVPHTRDPFALLPWPKAGTWSGPRPWAEVSSRPEFVEAGGFSPPLAAPFAVSGQLLKPLQEDRHRVPVVPKSKVRFEVFAERIGSPVDVALVIRDEKGTELARAEDGPGTLDPVLEFTAPDGVTAVLACVVDSQGRGSPRAVYRLTIDPAGSLAPPDFRLFTTAPRLTVPAGGRVVVPVFAERRGYTGKIDLVADGLPAGVKLETAAITPDADGALMTVTASGEPAASVANWKGRGDGGLERPVMLKGHPLERLQPWLPAELAVGTVPKSEFAIDWRGLPNDIGLSPGGKLALPVKVARPDPNTAVRLVLLTSQPPVLVNNQPDPNRSVRAEKPVELGPKVSDGELVVLVPPELSADGYDLAVAAELLSPDKQRVLASAFTTVRRAAVKMPVALKLDGLPRIEVKLDPKTGAAVEVKGTVERLNGFAGDAVVTLTGLPGGVQVPPVTVKAGETKFAVKVTLPPSTPPGETKGLKLSASVLPDPKQPNARVKTRDIELTLILK